jgi:FkbM family methyltransferase
MQGGYRIALRPRADAHEMNLYLDGIYEAGTLAFFDEVIRPGDTVVDVGANLGLMTLHAARKAAKVIAIEAHPATFLRLKRNIELNEFANVEALNLAAGAVNQDDRPIYDVPSMSIGRASLIEPEEAHSTGGTTKVRLLDDLVSGPVRLLKIDVEGFEAEVLRGSTRILAQRPIICMELVTNIPGEGGEDPIEAHRIVMRTGLYRCHRFAKSKFRPSPLIEVQSEAELTAFHDNLVYLPI